MGYFNKINRIVALAASLTLCGVCLAQSARHQEALEKMTVRIDSIVQRAAVPLDLSDPSSPARITSSQIFFDPDDMTEIQKYGPRAVPVLAKFLLNRNARIERVAIRLLGAIGGPAIADPLVEVPDKSSNSGSRTEALLNLKQAPCSKAVARAILRAAKSDPDPLVRRQAQEESRSCSM